jgi:signal transduction histidine kinase/ActR/RegA family two-component response regulator
MPTGRDAELVSTMLRRSDIEAVVVDRANLCDEIDKGTGVVLIAEEALKDGLLSELEQTIRHQPVWSDLPIIVFSGSSTKGVSVLQGMSSKFNATIVERPMRVTMLISAVSGALRARQRQYQTRDLLVQLKQADQQKDLFLATLSHELRTPLNSILGWIHILRRKEPHSPEVKHALDVIDRNARAQSEMISDILLVSRVITGKVELDQEPVEITSLLTESIDIIRPSAEAKRITIDLHTEKYTPEPIEGDPERLRQVFLNLLTNAVKFTADSGMIDVSLRGDDKGVEVEVRDNGCGIDPDVLPFIFERFRQADNKHTRRVGGLGLGLAIVSHLVELHGGEVRASSDGKGKGASFVVRLPVAATGQGISVPTTGTTADDHVVMPSLNGLTVLVVEDDTDSRDMLATILEHQGAVVATAVNAAEAFETFVKNVPDILISDVGLPGQDGYDLIRRIRSLSDANGGKVPAIALTGYVSLQDQTRARNAGYEEHLPKPIDTDRLIEMISKLTRRSRTTVGTL